MRKIYCDMDGVITNFKKMFYDWTGVDANEYAEKYGWPDFWETIGDAGLAFWADMEFNPGGRRLWNFLLSLNDEIEILTGKPFGIPGEHATMGKKLWVQTNLGDKVIINQIVGSKKQEYVKDKDILIDDREDTCIRWEKAGGISILHKDSEQTIQKLKEILNLN